MSALVKLNEARHGASSRFVSVFQKRIDELAGLVGDRDAYEAERASIKSALAAAEPDVSAEVIISLLSVVKKAEVTFEASAEAPMTQGDMASFSQFATADDD